MTSDQLLLGQIPEAIYFALFMIFTKRLKEKRILFTVVTTIEYTLLLDMDNPRIVEHLDKLAFALRLYCGI